MPKMKTNSAAKKRFKKVGSAKKKVKYACSMRRHILTKKSRKTKRNLRHGSYISNVDISAILKLLPY